MHFTKLQRIRVARELGITEMIKEGDVGGLESHSSTMLSAWWPLPRHGYERNDDHSGLTTRLVS